MAPEVVLSPRAGARFRETFAVTSTDSTAYLRLTRFSEGFGSSNLAALLLC